MREMIIPCKEHNFFFLQFLYSVLRYGKICRDEGILKRLKDLYSCPETRSDVKNLSMKAANAIEHNPECLTT